MGYMGNKKYWDDKFDSRTDKPLSPEKSLVENITYLKKGSVLDMACGDGRNTLFLLEKGFEVTGIDFSDKALERIKKFAHLNNYSVNTIQIDLDTPDSLKEVGIFDNIVINHYRLNRKQLEHIKDHITDNGILFINGFGSQHKVDSKIKKEDLIQPDDFDSINYHFELIKYSETQDERGFFVTYVFRRIEK